MADPIVAARAVLGLVRLVWAARRRDRRLGKTIAASAAPIARLGRDLAQAIDAAEAAPPGSDARRAAIARAAAAGDEVTRLLCATDDLRSAAIAGAEMMRGVIATPPRPLKQNR